MRWDRPRELKGKDAGAGRALAFIPVAVALVLAALLLPRGVVPDQIPLPELDDRIVAAEIRKDADRAEKARRVPLPADVRALGSAIRELNSGEGREARDVELSDARADIERARARVVGAGLDEDLLALRAVQMEGFLAEVRRFERTGQESDELQALAGGFVRRMSAVGWIEGHHVALGELALRAAFKTSWNKRIEVDTLPAFALSTMETRALYTLYFTHPHASEPQRAALVVARAQAKDAATCAKIDDGERAAAQTWLLTKLAEYAALDPAYPVALARGVAYYRRHQYGDAARAFSQWLEAHPNGPWTLRAKNYLRASINANEATF